RHMSTMPSDARFRSPYSSSALRENSWKSTPIEGAAGSLVIQQERPPNETVAKSPSIRLFRAFVCPPRFSDLRPPPTSGRGRFGQPSQQASATPQLRYYTDVLQLDRWSAGKTSLREPVRRRRCDKSRAPL